jgi:5-methyltetrahydropteroyltriglutamate--homocysteine methyltransferase
MPLNSQLTMARSRQASAFSVTAHSGGSARRVTQRHPVDVHGYFLEFDTPRAGGFAPLRLLPRDKVAAIRIMSSKTPVLEEKDDLNRRVEEATKFVSLDQLAISPQCGFASSIVGNPMTEQQQEEKLHRLVEIARSIWCAYSRF